MLMFWGDVLRVHGKNGKMFPPPLWVYRSQECLSLMVDVLKVLCTSISLMSWLRYTAHGAAACRSDCHSLSKWSSLLTRHDLLQKRSWSGIKRGHPRRGPPPSQHPVLYHRNSCWSLQRVSSGGNGGNPGVCDVAFWNCVFEKHDYPQVCDVHSRARHRLGDCQLPLHQRRPLQRTIGKFFQRGGVETFGCIWVLHFGLALLVVFLHLKVATCSCSQNDPNVPFL